MNAITQPELLREQKSRLDGPPIVDFQSNMKTATENGAGLFGLAREAFQIYLGPGHVTPAEFFYYRLWQCDLPLQEKLKFVSKQTQEAMHRACNDPNWHAVTHDKLLLHSVLEMAGLPMPPIEAVVHPTRFLAGQRRHLLGAKHLANAQSVRKFLSERANYPIFGKPIDGMYSLGAFHACFSPMHLEEMLTRIVVDGESAETEALAGRLLASPARYILQKPLLPHRELADLTGPRLCCARLLILLTTDGPILESAVLKIPVGTNIADNYWREGNLLGALDPDTGRISRVVTGTGSNLRESPIHPDTGASLAGQVVPAWPEICLLAMKAAHVFPGVRTQSWDIAITQDGPCILEINAGGDLNLHQLAHRRGALTPSLVRHLAAHGMSLRI
jgi:hypothetical protein